MGIKRIEKLLEDTSGNITGVNALIFEEALELQAKLDAVINAVYDGCDCDCRGNVNKVLQEKK
jgi:hypothetical protein